ncbi:MAG: hypothetical protein R6V31_10675 [Halohasta sp.]
MSEDAEALPPEIRESVPEFADDYLDRVAGRLVYNYDLRTDRRLCGERWDLFAEMRIKNQKQFFHPALSYADHDAEEYLLARRADCPTVDDLHRLVDCGHDLADDWVTADEEHYGTDITFVLIVDDILEPVADFVDGFRDRTLLKFGYYGHYDVNLVVVDPAAERCVASEAADVAAAFRLWDDVPDSEEGLLSRFARRFWQ